MNIPTSTPIFKFATIRSPTDETVGQPEIEIQPSTILVNSLVEIIESDKTQSDKIASINQKLNTFVRSKSFFKTKVAIAEAIGKSTPSSGKASRAPSTKTSGAKSEKDPHFEKVYADLYDNIVVRTITKSTTNEVFKSLIDNIKTLHREFNDDRDAVKNSQELKIILPEGLVISFSPPKQTPASGPLDADIQPSALSAQIQDLLAQQQRLETSRAQTSSQLAAEQEKLVSRQLAQGEMAARASENAARTQNPENTDLPQRIEPGPEIKTLVADLERWEQSGREIEARLADLNHRAFRLIPLGQYTYINDKWINIRAFGEVVPSKIEGNSIFVYHEGCYLKFPFQVADLRVVEQQSVGYLPGEIAHINNTQQGELNEKITRRLRRVESFESLITEDETFRETDTQSTEKFTLEKAASDVQSEEMAVNVNTSASGTYGVVTASVDAGFSSSQSAQNANSASQSYAREIVQRVVERVSNKVRTERNVKTLEEFEETVKHVIDNTKLSGPKSYVYRWLTKLSRATLKNYGKRLILQIDIPHPSHYYLSRLIKDSTLHLPPNPRDLKKNSKDPAIRTFYDTTQFPFEFRIGDIRRDNYLDWADLYNAKLEPPPPKELRINNGYAADKAENAVKQIPIPKGYKCKRAKVKLSFENMGRHYFLNEENAKWWVSWGVLKYMIGVKHGVALTGASSQNDGIIDSSVIPLADLETEVLPLSIFHYEKGYIVNIEIECELTAEAERAWQVKCHAAILEAYDNVKGDADAKMGGFDPNSPGLNPARKKELIKTELKKGALSKMFRCNGFWLSDDYKVGQEYTPDCCKDNFNGETVRFLEALFDWRNITYELYPYFYAEPANWSRLLGITDDDPHFEAFLQSSFATLRIPVYRDSEKERAAVNFIMNNSVANYSVVPGGMKALLDELGNAKPSAFTIGLDGEDLLAPIEVVDLGVFPVPTDLVILECGVENGIKPIGFPQAKAATTDVVIPKQYSPAIIADSCPVPTILPDATAPTAPAKTPDNKSDPVTVAPPTPGPALVPVAPGKDPKPSKP